MIKDLQVTLYDVFGYILPGLFVVAALFAAFMGCCLPALNLDAIPRGPWAATTLAVAGYMGGHLAQALGNLLDQRFRCPEDRIIAPQRSEKGCPAAILEGCRRRLSGTVGEGAASLSPMWLYRACDAAGSGPRSAERDLFTYREGFYRGMSVASLLWTAALLFLLVRLLLKHPPLRLASAHGAFDLTAGVLTFFLILSGVGAYLFFIRYRRFGNYRVSAALLGLLFSPPASGREEKAASSPAADGGRASLPQT